MRTNIRKIEYRLSNGYLVNHEIDINSGVTTEDIETLSKIYFQEIGRSPVSVFVEFDMFTKYVKKMMHQTYTYSPINSSNGLQVVTIHCSCGPISVIPVMQSYIHILAGTKEDYDNNNIDAAFEAIVLKDCERE